MWIVTITGLSGCGKDTAAEYLARKYGWNIIRSYTTRPMRDGEVNGKEHIFVDDPPVSVETCFAYTRYGSYEYWTKWGQFIKNNVNIYIVDEKGLSDIIDKESKGGFSTFKIALWCGLKTRVQRGVDTERMARDKHSRIALDESIAYDAIIRNGSSLEALYRRLDACALKLEGLMHHDT